MSKIEKVIDEMKLNALNFSDDELKDLINSILIESRGNEEQITSDVGSFYIGEKKISKFVTVADINEVRLDEFIQAELNKLNETKLNKLWFKFL